MIIMKQSLFVLPFHLVVYWVSVPNLHIPKDKNTKPLFQNMNSETSAQNRWASAKTLFAEAISKDENEKAQICWNCRSTAHSAIDCPKPASCYNCLGAGHAAHQCVENPVEGAATFISGAHCHNCSQEGHSTNYCKSYGGRLFDVAGADYMPEKSFSSPLVINTPHSVVGESTFTKFGSHKTGQSVLQKAREDIIRIINPILAQQSATQSSSGSPTTSLSATKMRNVELFQCAMPYVSADTKHTLSPRNTLKKGEASGQSALQKPVLTPSQQKLLKESMEILRPSVSGSVSLLDGIDPSLVSLVRAKQKQALTDSGQRVASSHPEAGGGLTEMRLSNLDLNIFFQGQIEDFRRRPDPSSFTKRAAIPQPPSKDINDEEATQQQVVADNLTAAEVGESTTRDNGPEPKTILQRGKSANKDVKLDVACDSVFIQKNAYEITRHHKFLPQAEVLRRQKIKADQDAAIAEQQRRQQAAMIRIARRAGTMRLTGFTLNQNRYAPPVGAGQVEKQIRATVKDAERGTDPFGFQQPRRPTTSSSLHRGNSPHVARPNTADSFDRRPLSRDGAASSISGIGSRHGDTPEEIDILANNNAEAKTHSEPAQQSVWNTFDALRHSSAVEAAKGRARSHSGTRSVVTHTRTSGTANSMDDRTRFMDEDGNDVRNSLFVVPKNLNIILTKDALQERIMQEWAYSYATEDAAKDLETVVQANKAHKTQYNDWMSPRIPKPPPAPAPVIPRRPSDSQPRLDSHLTTPQVPELTPIPGARAQSGVKVTSPKTDNGGFAFAESTDFGTFHLTQQPTNPAQNVEETSFRFHLKTNQMMVAKPPIRQWVNERAATLTDDEKGKFTDDHLFYNPCEQDLDEVARQVEEEEAKATGIKAISSSRRTAMPILMEVKELNDVLIGADDRQTQILIDRQKRSRRTPGGATGIAVINPKGNPQSPRAALQVPSTYGVPAGRSVREVIRKTNANTTFNKLLSKTPAHATVDIGPRCDPNIVLKWKMRFLNAKVGGSDSLKKLLLTRDAHRSVVASASSEVSHMATKCETGEFTLGKEGHPMAPIAVGADDPGTLAFRASLDAQRRTNLRKLHVAGKPIVSMWTQHCEEIASRAAEDKIRSSARVQLIEYLERLTGIQKAESAAQSETERRRPSASAHLPHMPTSSRRPSASHLGMESASLSRRSSSAAAILSIDAQLESLGTIPSDPSSRLGRCLKLLKTDEGRALVSAIYDGLSFVEEGGFNASYWTESMRQSMNGTVLRRESVAIAHSISSAELDDGHRDFNYYRNIALRDKTLRDSENLAAKRDPETVQDDTNVCISALQDVKAIVKIACEPHDEPETVEGRKILCFILSLLHKSGLLTQHEC